MRIIEKKMVNALTDNQALHSGNTTVTIDGSVFLFGNRIAFKDESGKLMVDVDTLKRYPTNTTKAVYVH